jgi:hypothetical protein
VCPRVGVYLRRRKEPRREKIRIGGHRGGVGSETRKLLLEQ